MNGWKKKQNKTKQLFQFAHKDTEQRYNETMTDIDFILSGVEVSALVRAATAAAAAADWC